jgi:hypothetical protein
LREWATRAASNEIAIAIHLECPVVKMTKYATLLQVKHDYAQKTKREVMKRLKDYELEQKAASNE